MARHVAVEVTDGRVELAGGDAESIHSTQPTEAPAGRRERPSAAPSPAHWSSVSSPVGREASTRPRAQRRTGTRPGRARPARADDGRRASTTRDARRVIAVAAASDSLGDLVAEDPAATRGARPARRTAPVASTATADELGRWPPACLLVAGGAGPARDGRPGGHRRRAHPAHDRGDRGRARRSPTPTGCWSSGWASTAPASSTSCPTSTCCWSSEDDPRGRRPGGPPVPRRRPDLLPGRHRPAARAVATARSCARWRPTRPTGSGGRRPWEFQALLKAAPVAGPPSCGDRFDAAVGRRAVVAAVRTPTTCARSGGMKGRAEAEVARTGLDRPRDQAWARRHPRHRVLRAAPPARPRRRRPALRAPDHARRARPAAPPAATSTPTRPTPCTTPTSSCASSSTGSSSSTSSRPTPCPTTATAASPHRPGDGLPGRRRRRPVRALRPRPRHAPPGRPCGSTRAGTSGRCSTPSPARAAPRPR